MAPHTYFFVAHLYFIPYYICVRFTVFIFKLVVLIGPIFYLRSLIYPQSAMNEWFSIISRPNTNWYIVDCISVWYLFRTANSVAANISDQG